MSRRVHIYVHNGTKEYLYRKARRRAQRAAIADWWHALPLYARWAIGSGTGMFVLVSMIVNHPH